MWVSFDIIHALAILTLSVVVGLMLFQSCTFIGACAIALFQFMFKSVRLPVKYIPDSLNGLYLSEISVSGVISGELHALPNSAYLVLATFIASPENSLNFSIVSTMVTICWGELWEAIIILIS